MAHLVNQKVRFGRVATVGGENPNRIPNSWSTETYISGCMFIYTYAYIHIIYIHIYLYMWNTYRLHVYQMYMDIFRRSTQWRTSDCHRSLLSCWLCTFRRCSWNESQRTADPALQRISIDAHVGYRKCDFEEMIWHFTGIVETYPDFQGIPQLNMIFCLSSIEPSLVSIEFSVHFATGLHWGLRQLPAGLDLESDQWTHSEISRNPERFVLVFWILLNTVALQILCSLNVIWCSGSGTGPGGTVESRLPSHLWKAWALKKLWSEWIEVCQVCLGSTHV